MSDLEITRLCAEAMGWKVSEHQPGSKRPYRVWQDDEPIYGIGEGWIMQKWNPLHDDAQAMTLVKKFTLRIDYSQDGRMWSVCDDSPCPEKPPHQGYADDLNRAICECVAKLKQGEGK